MIKINTSGDYVQLIYVDPVQESVQQELKSDTDAFECSYDSDGKLFMQFGAMRFENPDPTDFTINGVAVTDAADFISKLNALFTGGGRGSSFLPTSGTGMATGDITGDLNDFTLEMHNILGTWSEIGTHPGTEHIKLASKSSEDITASANIILTTNDDDGYSFEFSVTKGVDSVFIGADAVAKSLSYTADTHTFNGSVVSIHGVNNGTTINGEFEDVPDSEHISFYAQDLTGNGNVTSMDILSQVLQSRWYMFANFNDGVKVARIEAYANASESEIEYTADTHTFNGVLNLPVHAAPASPNDGDIWREDNTDTGLKIRINGITKTIVVS